MSFYPVEQNYKKRNNKNNISMPASKLQLIIKLKSSVFIILLQSLFVVIIINKVRVFENHDYNEKLGTA